MESNIWVPIGFIAGVILAAIFVLLCACGLRIHDIPAEAIASPAVQQSHVPLWLPTELYDKLKGVVYDVDGEKLTTEEVGGGSGCAICLEEYGEEEARATIKECGHRFHEFCIKKWLREKLNCPLCRLNLV